MAANYYFKYLKDSYDFLPESDKNLLAETWAAYEQIVGNLYNKNYLHQFATTTAKIQVFDNERWIKFTFNSDTEIKRNGYYLSPLDLTGGVNLTSKYLLRFSTDEIPPTEVDLRGVNPLKTTAEEISQKINSAVGFNFCRKRDDGKLEFVNRTTGPSSYIEFIQTSNPALNCSELVLGILDTNLPKKFPEFPYVYANGNNTIAEIPRLTNSMREESITTILFENVDFRVERGSGIITFKNKPLEEMWAEDVKQDLEQPYNNFGYLVDYYDANSKDYLDTLKSIWYAFWVGPKPNNIRRALGLIFGIPAANQSGTVKNVNNAYIRYKTDIVFGDNLGPEIKLIIPLSEDPNVFVGQQLVAGAPYTNNILTVTPTSGVVLEIVKANIEFIEDSENGELEGGDLVKIEIPQGLHPIVSIGQRLRKYDLFTDGINIYDHINYPGFLEAEVGRIGVEGFLTEDASRGTLPHTDETKALKTAEVNTYLIQVDSSSFVRRATSFLNIKNFLDQITPVHTTYIFQLLVSVDDTLVMQEKTGFEINFDVTPNLDYNPWLEGEDSVLDDGESAAGEELCLDSEVFGNNETASVDIYHNASSIPTLIDTFAF